MPFAGPFIGIIPLSATPQPDAGEIVGIGLLVLDGLGQLAGAGLLIAGLVQKKHVLVREDAATPTVRVTPLTLGHGGMGIGLVGTM